MDTLEAELVAAIAASRYYARRNYFLGYMVAGASVVSSILAGISVSFPCIPPQVTAVLASIPAAMIATTTTFRFEQKSAWFWRKAKRQESLLRSIRYEAVDVATASKTLSQIEEDMEQEWVSFGTPAKKA
ncbi:hypothetical protein GTP45_14850 [Pseudoduganella sp. FT55W]|uniref:DUF4231 domain-containing protein n=1 Tax=Duganella rivi TaxID=2666083 RepID=A0A7X4GS19_9BURK|nr:hypothetical protein [Duganella rivi]MYM68101.1 hypothetical protein [Duganella rivi]